MSKKKRKKQDNVTDRVEFGMEFGEINANKQMDVLIANKEKKKKK